VGSLLKLLCFIGTLMKTATSKSFILPAKFFFTIPVILLLPHHPITESRFIMKRSLVMLRQSWLPGVLGGKANLDRLTGMYRIARRDFANAVGSGMCLSGTSNLAEERTRTMVISQFREIFHKLTVNMFRIQRSRNLETLLLPIPRKS